MATRLVKEIVRASASQKRKKRANKQTLAAHKEALEGKGNIYKTRDDFWKDMEVAPEARP